MEIVKKLLVTCFLFLIIPISIIWSSVNVLSSHSDVGDIKSLKEVDVKLIYEKEKNKCTSDDFNCIESQLVAVTSDYGPQATAELFTLLKANNHVSGQFLDHQMGHRVGEVTAKKFGLSYQSFMRCPVGVFSYGCQHGFFVYALSKNGSAINTAINICGETVKGNNSFSLRLTCYHGIGHGLMMAFNYDLTQSLGVCDRLLVLDDRENCYEGVFMEYTTSMMNGEIVPDSPNAHTPCDQVLPKYQPRCYLVHSPYLIKYFNNSVKEASGECFLLQDITARLYCAHSFGNSFANPNHEFAIDNKIDSQFVVTREIEYCKLFNGDMRLFCYYGTLQQVVEKDFPNMDLRAFPYCEQVEGEFRDACSSYLSSLIAQHTKDSLVRLKLCTRLPIFQWDCLTRSIFESKAMRLGKYLLASSFPAYTIRPIQFVDILAN